MEPERDIEKTLRAYAKMRREEGGVPPELHPAARMLLRAEVAAQRGRARQKATTWAGLLWGTWPRLAFTIGSAVAVLVAAGFLLVPAIQGPPETLAQNDKDLSVFKKLDEPVARRDEADKARQAPALAAKESQPPAANSAPAASLAQSQHANPAPAKNELQTPPATSSTQAVLPPTLAAGQFDLDTLAMGERKQKSSIAVVTQQFARADVQIASDALKDAGAASAVLKSFRIEQAGDQLRVIDSDGSVYTGTVLRMSDAAAFSKAAPQNAAIGGLSGATAEAPAQTRAKTPVPEYTFRVSGSNTTLNQPVEFSGNFVISEAQPAAPAPTPIARGGGAGGGRRGGAAARMASTNAPGSTAPAPAISADVNQPLTLRLRGEVIVGTNRSEVEAVPMKN